MAKNPRELPPRLLEARQASLTNPPKTISSKDLPSAIRYHLKIELLKHRRHTRTPWLDPRIAQNGAYLPGAKPIERLYDEGGREVIEVINPFLIARYPVENFHPYPQEKVKTRVHRPISRRDQSILTAQYPPHVLPPSHLNPIERPPLIRWEGKNFSGALIKWVGEWTPKERKGIYHNRGIMFKGKRRERERLERDDEVAERVAGMDYRIDKWRKVSCDLGFSVDV